ncbi:MAG: hypothetical protein JZD41_08180 [Thermoproteus sp.]|nr:hypothetical protein [Thermoproteus sp.]
MAAATAVLLASRASTRAGKALWPLSLASLYGLLYAPLALLQLSALLASAIEAYASLRNRGVRMPAGNGN